MSKILNERVRNLFLSMINHPEKIVKVKNNEIIFDNNLSIKYWNQSKDAEDIDNETLKLQSLRFGLEYWNFAIDIIDHLVFSIVTPYRQYYVPDFTDRLEYARVLNILDNILENYENRKLSEYESYFSNPKPFNDTISPSAC